MSTQPLEKIDRTLQALPERPGETVDVIVSLVRGAAPEAGTPAADAPSSTPPDRAALAAQAQARFDTAAAPLLARLHALGAQQVRPLWIAHAVAARLPRAALGLLAAEDTVARIAPDTERKLI